jgi:hypothetical protein
VPFGLTASGEIAETDGYDPTIIFAVAQGTAESARWRRGAVPSSTAAPYNGDDQRGSMQAAIRSVQPCAILAAVAGALVLAAITGVRLDAVPALLAKIILGVSLPVLYGAMLGAIRPRSRPGPAAGRPGPRPDYGNGTPVADDDLRHPSEAERLSAWRRTRLVALGVPEDVALVHAEDAFSVHELNRLRSQGCPLGTALRILWPA